MYRERDVYTHKGTLTLTRTAQIVLKNNAAKA